MIRYFACLWFLLISPIAWSSESDLLLLAQAHLDASKGLVADVLLTEMEMIENGKSLGTMHLKERIVEWQQGKPIRSIIYNSQPEHAAVAKARFKIMVDDYPDQSLREGLVVRTSQDSVDGKLCIVFQREQKKPRSVLLRSTLWIEVSTGLPVKAVHQFAGVPMTESMTHTLTFTKRDGKVLPLTLVVDATVSAFFQTMRIISKYQFVSWKDRAEHSVQFKKN